MKKVVILILVICAQMSLVFAENIKPQYLTSSQSTSYELVNESLAVIFNKIKTRIKTNKYPKYFNNYTTINDDGTQSKNYKYVKYKNHELIYSIDTNELKYVAHTRPELQKCRIMYEYPSGSLYAVQIYVSKDENFIFGPDGKYIDYAPYVKNIHEKIRQAWQVPSRKEIEKLAKGKKDLLVQVSMTVGKDGHVKKIIVLKSSKIKILDNNALDAIKRASPFDPFPKNFFNEEIIITQNFNFNL